MTPIQDLKKSFTLSLRYEMFPRERKMVFYNILEMTHQQNLKKKINEGPRSLIIELSLKGPFAVKKKDFSSIIEMATSSSQDKSLKKIKKLFSEKFKNFTSVREKQVVSKIYTMYLKQLKEGNIGKSKREFRQFLKNILEN